ncbi:hypothetical protein TRFO_21482 [Tritrichomonas foetus]|uniref:Uncharacterized protein n=1 Tax=Tritrichomonas foetus TaxID=1144522 RepID=A0A1J4KEZ1_9EUKA|nr:hypothetical protein TRFO_21482 [Tritrichomonas foetus]|eukprot:OHT09594.1 hypothetical protein TRFO_21482 [Tritrichomonas foetus]
MELRKQKLKEDIISASSIYHSLADQLQKPVQFLRFPAENSINAEISSIFSEAASILKQSIEKEIVIPDHFYALDLQIQALKEQIDELTFDIENQQISFDETLTNARQILADQINALNKDYQTRITKLIIRNHNEEVEMENTLDVMRDNYEDQIEKEFSAQLAERNEIKKQLIQLKKDYEETNSFLNAQIMAVKEREAEFECQSFSNIRSNFNSNNGKNSNFSNRVNNLNSIERDNYTSLSSFNFNEEVERKRSEKLRLVEELNTLKSKYISEKEELLSKIDAAKKNQEKNLQRSINRQQANYERRKEQLEALFKEREKQLNKKITHVEKQNKRISQKIKKEIQENEKIVAESEVRLQNALNEINNRTESTLDSKDKEIQLLEEKNQIERDEIERSHQISLQTMKEEEAKVSSNNSYETKITQEQRQVRQQKLAQQQDRIRSFNNTDIHPLLKSPRRTESQHNLDSNIDEKVVNLEKSSNLEILSLSRAIEAVEEQYNINQQILQSELERSKRQYISISQKIENIHFECENLNTFSKIFSKIEKKEKLNDQEKTINRLTEQLNEIKKGEIPKVELAVIQNEHQKEIEQKKCELNEIKINSKKLIEKVQTSYNSQIIDEQKKRQKQLKNISLLISEAEEEIRKTKNFIENGHCRSPIREYKNLLKMKRSNNESLHEQSPRSASFQRIQMETKFQSTLPLLKQ